MAAEVLAAYKWTAQHVSSYGGSPAHIAVMGHSAGGHLGSLALLMLAQQKHLATQQHQHQHQHHQQQQQEPFDVRVPQVHLVHPGAANSPSSSSSSSISSLQSQHHSMHQQGLPDQQLQQRADLAAAEAAHQHHYTHHDQPPTSQALQQQQQQQHPQQRQQQQQLGPHWLGTGHAVLGIPTPVAFIGMSSIYDVARHFEFESLRGVSAIRTRPRACGGADNFYSVPPAALLPRGAAAAAAAGGCSGSSGSWGSTRREHISSSSVGARQEQAGQQVQQGRHDGQPWGVAAGSSLRSPPAPAAAPGAASGPELLGEVIPFRSGLDGSRQQTSTDASGSGAPQETGGSSGMGCPVSSVLAGFSKAAADSMPPCILMSRWVSSHSRCFVLIAAANQDVFA